MSNPFTDVAAALVTLEEMIQVSAPDGKITRAFAYPPAALQQMDTPCIINRLFAAPGTLAWGAGEHRITIPTQMTIVVADADPATGEARAVALMWGLLQMLITNQRLGGTIDKLNPVSAGPAGDLEYPAESGQHFQHATVTADLVLELPQIGSGG